MDDNVIIGRNGVISWLADIVFPNRCPFCGGFIRYDLFCCGECFSGILWTDESVCTGCGKQKGISCRCGSINYDMCVTAAFYEGAAKNGILSLKFKNNLSPAVIFGRVLREKLEIAGVFDRIDIAVPVPMSDRQKRARGYNQAEALTRQIIKGTDIPMRTDLIFRRYSKTAQHTLTAEERQKAAKEIYYRADNAGNPLTGKTVLLADDVLTTGATLSVCAGLLKELGAETVICAAAATTA